MLPKKLQLLVIGRRPDMLKKITALLQQQGFEVKGTLTNEEATQLVHEHFFDGVIIGGGVDEQSRNYFHREFPLIQSQIKIIDTHPSSILSDVQKTFSL